MRFTRVIAIAIAALLAVPAAASAAALTRSATGASPAAIQASVDQFRADLGGANNGVGGTFPGGRREINWDGVPNGFAAPNSLPGDFFNVFSQRGVRLFTTGTGFQVSAAAANETGTPVRFANFGAGFSAAFQTFSAQRLFTPVTSTVTDVRFSIPGTDRPATVRGFGAVFTDVDAPLASGLEFFDPRGQSLGVVNPPATNNGISFVGASFTADERVARVRVTTGNEPLSAGATPDSTVDDTVVADDFIYAEPQALRSDFAITQTESADPVAAHGQVTYTVQVRNDGPDFADSLVVESDLQGGRLAAVPPRCEADRDGLRCEVEDLGPGSSRTIEVVADAPAQGEVVHTASVDSLADDSDPADDTTTERTAVTPRSEPEPPAADPVDERAPEPSVEGAPQKLKLKRFLKGVAVELDADEAASYEVALLGSARKVTLGRAKAFDVTLASASMAASDDAQTVVLKPKRKLVRRAKRLTARVQVVATDAAGNDSDPLTRDIRVGK